MISHSQNQQKLAMKTRRYDDVNNIKRAITLTLMRAPGTYNENLIDHLFNLPLLQCSNTRHG